MMMVVVMMVVMRVVVVGAAAAAAADYIHGSVPWDQFEQGDEASFPSTGRWILLVIASIRPLTIIDHHG